VSFVFACGLRLRVLLWSAAVDRAERAMVAGCRWWRHGGRGLQVVASRWSRVEGGGVVVVAGCRWWRRGGRRLLLEMGGVKLGYGRD